MQLSQRRGAALVARLNTPAGEVVGLAYYVLTPDDSGAAEPAFLVEDRFQGQGLGRALFEGLIREAQSQALCGFQLFILPENQRMLHLLDQGRFPAKRHYRDGMFEVRMEFAPNLS